MDHTYHVYSRDTDEGMTLTYRGHNKDLANEVISFARDYMPDAVLVLSLDGKPIQDLEFL